MTSTQTIDLNTTAGIIEHCKNLPTENLRNLAARTWIGEATIAHAAQCELILRGEV